jgi:hypothetical protein
VDGIVAGRSIQTRRQEVVTMPAHATTVHEEHARFTRQLDRIAAVADAVGTLTPDELMREVQDIHGFLAYTLLPHAVAEGRVLFPVVRGTGEEPVVTVAMNQCHRSLSAMTDELEHVASHLGRRADPELERNVRRLLYGIHALATAHLDQLEAEVDPILSRRLSVEARVQLFEALDRCADEARAIYD